MRMLLICGENGASALIAMIPSSECDHSAFGLWIVTTPRRKFGKRRTCLLFSVPYSTQTTRITV